MNRAIFVVDCLRYDAFPPWFKGTVQRFESAYNTPLYFNSLFMGRNLFSEYQPMSRRRMFRLYLTPPSNPHLLTRLHARGVSCYWRSDAANVYHHTWWSKQMQRMPPTHEPWFLLYHDFGVHTHQGRIGSFKERKLRHREYLCNVDDALRRIEHAIRLYHPDVYVVMGDHGEEFHLDKEGPVMYGHGTFSHPILTPNVQYTGLHASDDTAITTFPDLYRWVLS